MVQHSINICLWTLYPLQNFILLYKIEHQCIRMLNNNGIELHWMNFSSPFVECLKDVEILYWAGETFYLSPDVNKELSISWIPTPLTMPNIYIYLSLPTILTHSTLLHQYLQHNKCFLAEH